MAWAVISLVSHWFVRRSSEILSAVDTSSFTRTGFLSGTRMTRELPVSHTSDLLSWRITSVTADTVLFMICCSHMSVLSQTPQFACCHTAGERTEYLVGHVVVDFIWILLVGICVSVYCADVFSLWYSLKWQSWHSLDKLHISVTPDLVPKLPKVMIKHVILIACYQLDRISLFKNQPNLADKALSCFVYCNACCRD